MVTKTLSVVRRHPGVTVACITIAVITILFLCMWCLAADSVPTGLCWVILSITFAAALFAGANAFLGGMPPGPQVSSNKFKQ